MAQTPTMPCPNPKCSGIVIRLTIEQNPLVIPVLFNATPDPEGHVVETGIGTGRTLKADRSDAGEGEDIFKIHYPSCGA